MATGVRTKYHIAINGNGFMLRGAPKTPRYLKEEAPTLINQLGLGDLDYNKLNGAGWSFWTQTDWSGGFQSIKFKDDASFRSGQAVDVLSKFGEVKLQEGFLSAAVISGSHTMQSRSVHEHKLLMGTVKSGAAKLFSLTSAGTLATLSAYSAISAVNTLERFGANTLIGLKKVSGSVDTWAKYDGATISGFRSTNLEVRKIKAVGIRAYYSENVAALSGDQFGYTTDLATFTSAYNAGKGREIPEIESVAGNPHFFIREGNKVEMFKWDELSERAFLIHKWDDLTNFGVTNYLSFIIITGTTAGKRIAFAFNGSRLWQIFEDQLEDSNFNFKWPFEHKGNLHTQGAQWDGKFWFPGLYGDYQGKRYTPFANFGKRAYGFAVSGTSIIVGHTSAGHYATSGHIVSSEFGHEIGGVDKLINSVDLNMKVLAGGQTVEILRSTDGGASFTSLGTASFATDGAISGKTLYFPSGFVSKLYSYKAQLATVSAATTPVLQDVTFQYRPIPDLKKRWRLSIDAGDNVKLLNEQDEQRPGKDLMSELWLEKETKRTVSFEDVDAWNTTIVSAMAKADTSARVATTRLIPPKGRMRVVSAGVVEEMTYTSAEGKRIKGITRGKKGTLARAYVSATAVDNHYNTIVTNIVEEVNDTDQQRTESIALISLLEV